MSTVVAAGPRVGASSLEGRRVAVVGGGVAGASLAWAAARAGAEVTLLEEGGVGASSLPAALINPHRGRSGRASRGDLLGAEAVWRWSDGLAALGLDGSARRGGVLRAASDERQRRSWADLAGVRHLRPGRHGPFRLPHGGFVVEGGGWLRPSAWLRALTEAARRSGATIREGARATAIERRPGSPRVVTVDGAVADADLIAICIGSSPPRGLPCVPLRLIAGEVVLTPHPPVGHALAGSVYVAPAETSETVVIDDSGAGLGVAEPPHLLAVGGNHRDVTDPPPSDADLARLLARLRWVLPTIGEEVHDVWTGIRARGPGVEPIVREIEPAVWWVGAFGGRGFLRAAATAEELVARWTAS